MQKKPHILDLFCAAGGAAMGYHQSGFEIIGCDNKPQPNYPFKFFKGDWQQALQKYSAWADAIHASPPCQEYSVTRSLHSNTHDALIEPVRQALQATGKPYIIENVPPAPLRNAIILDGPMFNLKVIKKRKFESNVLLLKPGNGAIHGKVIEYAKQRLNPDYYYYITAGHMPGTVKQWSDALGISWMKNKSELAQAIPPSYTHFLGNQLQQFIT